MRCLLLPPSSTVQPSSSLSSSLTSSSLYYLPLCSASPSVCLLSLGPCANIYSVMMLFHAGCCFNAADNDSIAIDVPETDVHRVVPPSGSQDVMWT